MEKLPLLNFQTVLVKGRIVMRSCLFISLVFHLIILLAAQRVIPMDWLFKAPQIYEVALLRLPVDPEIQDERVESALADADSGKEAPKTKPGETEHTISLDTKDVRYVSYAKLIKARLMEEWTYPRKAVDNLIEGRVKVLFTLNANGRLIRLQIIDPSGQRYLDNETARAIRAASPFPPFPESMSLTRLHIKANFDYRLTAKKP
jgi:TonB family protein